MGYDAVSMDNVMADPPGTYPTLKKRVLGSIERSGSDYPRKKRLSQTGILNYLNKVGKTPVPPQP
jgi:hypothetical protein